MRKIEYWLTPDGRLIETEQNPCGCHPFDFIVKTEGIRPKYLERSGVSLSFKNRREFRNYMNRRWAEKLGEGEALEKIEYEDPGCDEATKIKAALEEK